MGGSRDGGLAQPGGERWLESTPPGSPGKEETLLTSLPRGEAFTVHHHPHRTWPVPASQSRPSEEEQLRGPVAGVSATYHLKMPNSQDPMVPGHPASLSHSICWGTGPAWGGDADLVCPGPRWGGQSRRKPGVATPESGLGALGAGCWG